MTLWVRRLHGLPLPLAIDLMFRGIGVIVRSLCVGTIWDRTNTGRGRHGIGGFLGVHQDGFRFCVLK